MALSKGLRVQVAKFLGDCVSELSVKGRIADRKLLSRVKAERSDMHMMRQDLEQPECAGIDQLQPE